MKKRIFYLKNEQLLKNRMILKDEEIKIAQKLVQVEKSNNKNIKIYSMK